MFALRDISRQRSNRARCRRPWEYVFYVDILRGDDEPAQRVAAPGRSRRPGKGARNLSGSLRKIQPWQQSPTQMKKIPMDTADRIIRRNFIVRSTAVGAGLVIPAWPQRLPGRRRKEGRHPAEDLMREHGVLNPDPADLRRHLRLLDAKQTFDRESLPVRRELSATSWRNITRSWKRIFCSHASVRQTSCGPGGHASCQHQAGRRVGADRATCQGEQQG